MIILQPSVMFRCSLDHIKVAPRYIRFNFHRQSPRKSENLSGVGQEWSIYLTRFPCKYMLSIQQSVDSLEGFALFDKDK